MVTPSLPHIVSIVIRDTDGNVESGVTVTATNETTGETITANDTTNALGQALIDIANFPSGYSEDDFIQITASGSGSGSVGQDLRFKAVNYGDYVQIDELHINYEI